MKWPAIDPRQHGEMKDTMQTAIKRFLKDSVTAYPNPMQWWAFILNATKGNFQPLLEGYKGDILATHRAIIKGE